MGLLLLLVGSVVCESKITDETTIGEGERAMKGLVAAKVKMEKKIGEMSNFIENELQVKEIQGTQYKRRKRETYIKKGKPENPFASLNKTEVFELLKTMRTLVDTFKEFTEMYIKKRNATKKKKKKKKKKS